MSPLEATVGNTLPPFRMSEELTCKGSLPHEGDRYFEQLPFSCAADFVRTLEGYPRSFRVACVDCKHRKIRP